MKMNLLILTILVGGGIAFVQNENTEYESIPRPHDPIERKMAISVVKALETHIQPEGVEEVKSEQDAKKILDEVDRNYLNIAKKIHTLDRNRKKVEAMKRRLKNKLRFVRRKLRRFSA